MPKKEHEDILDQANERFKLAADTDRDERVLADDDIRFATNDEGCQWPAELRKQREDSDRPCLVANKILEKIDQVDGEFRQLRPSFKVRAIDSVADPQIAEIISGTMRHIEYNSTATTAYQTAHTSVLYCGRGAWRINLVDAEDDPFVRDIVIDRIPNVLTVYWDPFAKQADKSDADYFFVTEIISEKEFKRNHKEIYDNWPSDDTWDEWRTKDGFRIAEYWYKEKTKQKYYRVQRGDSVVTVEELGDGEEFLDEKTADKVRVRWCKMVAKKILEGPNEWPTTDIPIIVELGKEINIRGMGKTRGMPRHAKDPCRMYNYWTSMATEQISLAPKAPYIVDVDSIADFQHIWENAHRENYAYLPYKVNPNNPGGAPRREPPPPISSAYQYEFMRLEHDIMSAMGIYQASLGDEGQEVSGRAIMARQRQGNIGSYPYTDSFNIAYSYSCKQLIRLIPHIYDTERIIRIVGEDGNEDMVPINARPDIPQAQELPKKLKVMPRQGITDYLNDITVGKYDVAVTIGPSYTTQREETLNILMDLLKTAPQIATAIIDLVAENIDIPKHSEEIVKRLKKMVPVGIRDLEPNEQPPQQQPDPQIMLDMARLQLDKEKSDREMERKEFEAKVDAIAKLTTAESKEIGDQVSRMVTLITQMREDMRMRHDMQAQQMQMGHDMQSRDRELSMQEAQAQAGQVMPEAPEEGMA